MISGLLKKIFGSRNDRLIKQYSQVVRKINALEAGISALSDEGLRVEMFWSTPNTDMDVHVMDPAGTRWFTALDCNYSNCRGGTGLPWGDAGTVDNPRLDIDDTNGYGPENINITRAAAGSQPSP